MFSQVSILLAIFAIILCQTLALNVKFSREMILKPFQNGNALKIISGLHNLDKINVKNVAWAANFGGASHIDIACDMELIKLVKSISTIPICVSSVKPSDFVLAIEAGADMIEIGNFDSFYDFGINFTAEDIIEMTKTTRKLLPDTVLSVTIPHILNLSQQITLAKELESIGCDIIQTEGKMKSNINGLGIQELIELSAPTIASAYALSRAVKIPIMCSSGLTDVTASLAIAAGAKGVGIGSMVNKLKTSQQMLLAVNAIAESMGRKTFNNEIFNNENANESVNENIFINKIVNSNTK